MKYIQALFIVVLFMSFALPEDRKIRIFLAGDSTMKEYNVQETPQRGWGQMLHLFFDDDVEIINKARGGRSTKSFIK